MGTGYQGSKPCSFSFLFVDWYVSHPKFQINCSKIDYLVGQVWKIWPNFVCLIWWWMWLLLDIWAGNSCSCYRKLHISWTVLVEMWALLCLGNKVISILLLISALITVFFNPIVDSTFFVEGIKLIMVNRVGPQLEWLGSLEGGPTCL